MTSFHWIKTIYLYVVSVIGLIVGIIGVINLLNTIVKLTVFDKYPIGDYSYMREVKTPDGTTTAETREEYTARIEGLRKERKVGDLTNSIGMSVVGGVLYLYHWRLARKET